MLYQNENDETLVMLTLAGEQQAYEVLVVRYQKTVISSAASVTHNQFMAEDAAQDAFVTAWMKLNTLQEPEKFCAWVCRIAKNCALNMVTRFREFLPIDLLDHPKDSGDQNLNPAELYALSEEKDELHQSIGKLPEKVKQIICLHYFEGLSIAEIAAKMSISVGTVKWQLHDGRKRIRKELCAMNEKWNDTLVQKVMKKVEELKLWQTKNSKNGFEAVYRNVLREVEDLPECKDKYHALADVLMRGWWWLPGEKNDALFARIKDAAEYSKNEEVMEFIVRREDSQVYGDARIEFIRDTQIPRLEKAGFVRALAREWFWLGYNYFRSGNPEKGNEAYNKVEELLNPSDAYYALVPYAREMERKLAAVYKDKREDYYLTAVNTDELRKENGTLCYWKNKRFVEGDLIHSYSTINKVFRNSSRCDGLFFVEGLKAGETYTGSDGTTLTYAGDGESVLTPSGKFDGCKLIIITQYSTNGKATYRSYYKDGVGIVKHEYKGEGFSDVRVLKSYQIKGGKGLLPLAVGNTWEYAAEYAPDVMAAHLEFTVTYADEQKVLVSSSESIERLKYDENAWSDMMAEIRNEYWKKKEGVCDVSYPVMRAEALAKTPVEKAHTQAACSVARRIMETDSTLSPNFTATGYWNFFSRGTVLKRKEGIYVTEPYCWSFELKSGRINSNDISAPLLFNDIYGILQDATMCIWSDEWRIGASPLVEYLMWDTNPIKTQITCTDGGEITTKAGTFHHCIKISLDIHGMNRGISYRGGKKDYYFADGVGIVRTVNEYCDGARKAVYELTAYEGTGEGYMPLSDGMMRRYDAIDLHDGFVGSAEYTYVADEDGDIVILSNRTGIRQTLPSITQYDSIQGEVIEEQLWKSGKRAESRLRHDVNNFHLLTHFLGRPNRYSAAPERAVAWNKYRMQVMESLSEDRTVPPAWLSHYASTCFRTACALFGINQKEEGYEYLERSFDLFQKWEDIADGEELEVGNPLIYGGIKVVKGKGILKLPDGTIEPLSHEELFCDRSSLMYYGMTAPHGWEWFNSVRTEERFKEYIEQAKKLMETNG